MLTIYELDLGLNHVVRRSSEVIPATANHLVALPGGKDGPSGVLVCSEGNVEWRGTTGEGEGVVIGIPKREGFVGGRGTFYKAYFHHCD